MTIAASIVTASERCQVEYSVRVLQPGQDVATGTEIHTVMRCVSSLSKCHIDAEEIALSDARTTLAAKGKEVAPDGVAVIDINTRQGCP